MADRPLIVAVGGGGAGFFAAIACAEENPAARVLLLESTAHLLAKVRISGGGRCNVTHACFEPRELVRRYPRGHAELLGPFHRWQPRDTVAWFAARGVELKTEADGRMFPVTDNSATIVDCLQRAAASAGVTVRTGSGVRAVGRLPAVAAANGGASPPTPDARAHPPAPGPSKRFELALADGTTVACERLILATGGGRSSGALALAQSLGHAIEPPVPSLFTFHIADPRLAGLAGVSVENVVATVAGTALRESGPLLVTHAGLSGPAVLKLSAWGARELAAAGYAFGLGINFAPPHTRSGAGDALAAARAAHPRRQLGSHCPFALPTRLWHRLLEAAGVAPSLPWANFSRQQAGLVAAQVVDAAFTVTGKSMNKEEFVTCGGVRLAEVDFRTMESRLCPGLHFAGEMLDLDGITGGFNFQAAWTTGWIAGRAAAAG